MAFTLSGDRVVCAVDVGTSSVRAALLDPAGTIVASSRVDRARSAKGLVDVDALWRDFVAAVRALAEGEIIRVAALAVAAHVGTVLADDKLRVIRAGGWGDTTGVDELAEDWRAAPELLAITGRPMVTGGAAAMSAWMRRFAPSEFDAIRHVLSVKDMLLWRVTNVIATDVSSAGYTLLSDVREHRWSCALLSSLGLDASALPPQFEAVEVIGGVTAGASAELHLPEGLPVVCGGPDGTVGALAMIGVSTDAIADVSGTTDVVLSLRERYEVTPVPVVQNPFLKKGLWSSGGPTGFTGGAVAHWAGLLGVGDRGVLGSEDEALLAAMTPGAAGLMVNPHLTGSRFPDWDPAERAALHGMSDAHTALHIVRAAQEASAYVVRAAIEALSYGSGAGDRGTREVFLGGGTARSAGLVRLRADVLGCPVRVVADPEVTLRGAAMLACVGIGHHADLAAAHAAMCPATELTLPRADASREYTRLYTDWQAWRRGRTVGNAAG